MQREDLTSDQLRELALSVPYRKFRDSGPIERIPVLGTAWGLLRETGIYRGDFAYDWIRGELKNLGVKTFGDLAIDDDNLLPERRYRLTVTVTDLTTGQLVRLPWDYRRVYGLDPDEQLVADAVRASMAIPFLFHPVTLKTADGKPCTLVDGGVLSNFPIDSFDRPDGAEPRWPTFGVTVVPYLPAPLGAAADSRVGDAGLRPSDVPGELDLHDAGRSRPGLPESAVGEGPRDPGGFDRRRGAGLRHLAQ